jgi:hypothetical protein
MDQAILTRYLVLVAFLLISACSEAIPSPDVSGRRKWTDLEELDRVIEITLSGDIDAFRSILQFTQTKCTYEMGLGGPPKCINGEIEGDSVEVLPFQGPEGQIGRKEDIGSWDGIGVSDVYAIYTVSDTAYSDPNYPKGTHAVVFTDEAGTGITAQVIDGQIVRIDFSLSSPPEIREANVDEYLLPP